MSELGAAGRPEVYVKGVNGLARDGYPPKRRPKEPRPRRRSSSAAASAFEAYCQPLAAFAKDPARTVH